MVYRARPRPPHRRHLDRQQVRLGHRRVLPPADQAHGPRRGGGRRASPTREIPYAVSGRCSVFCKSDCTHALNKGETDRRCHRRAVPDDLAERSSSCWPRSPHDNVMVVGGTRPKHGRGRAPAAGNRQRSIVPEEAPYFEALGAALAAFDRGDAVPGSSPVSRRDIRTFPLCRRSGLASLVTFKTHRVRTRRAPATRASSASTSARRPPRPCSAALRPRRFWPRLPAHQRQSGRGLARSCYRSPPRQIGGHAGRPSSASASPGRAARSRACYALTDGVINEIIAHATAAVHFDPEVDTIFEIGGQDAKYTYSPTPCASDYAMNEACSAGTGIVPRGGGLRDRSGSTVSDIAAVRRCKATGRRTSTTSARPSSHRTSRTPPTRASAARTSSPGSSTRSA